MKAELLVLGKSLELIFDINLNDCHNTLKVLVLIKINLKRKKEMKTDETTDRGKKYQNVSVAGRGEFKMGGGPFAKLCISDTIDSRSPPVGRLDNG